jgi:hypothetical protein
MNSFEILFSYRGSTITYSLPSNRVLYLDNSLYKNMLKLLNINLT